MRMRRELRREGETLELLHLEYLQGASWHLHWRHSVQRACEALG